RASLVLAQQLEIPRGVLRGRALVVARRELVVLGDLRLLHEVVAVGERALAIGRELDAGLGRLLAHVHSEPRAREAARPELVPAARAGRGRRALALESNVRADPQPAGDRRVGLGPRAHDDLRLGHEPVQRVLAIEHRLVLALPRDALLLRARLGRRRVGRGADRRWRAG